MSRAAPPALKRLFYRSNPSARRPNPRLKCRLTHVSSPALHPTGKKKHPAPDLTFFFSPVSSRKDISISNPFLVFPLCIILESRNLLPPPRPPFFNHAFLQKPVTSPTRAMLFSKWQPPKLVGSVPASKSFWDPLRLIVV